MMNYRRIPAPGERTGDPGNRSLSRWHEIVTIFGDNVKTVTKLAVIDAVFAEW